MKKNKKLLTAAVALIMIFSLSFSALFIAKEAKHSCSMSDCQICRQISVCLDLLSGISSAPGTGAVLLSAAFAVVLLIGSVKKSAVSFTLIELKVKLSN